MNHLENECGEVDPSRGVSRAVVMDLLESPTCRCLGVLLLALVIAKATLGMPVFTIVLYMAAAAAEHPVEASASFFGVFGTLLLATRSRWAGWGFVAFLASNAGWLWFAHANDHRWMFLQQVAFTASSLVGIWVWLVKSRHAPAGAKVLGRDRLTPQACADLQRAASYLASNNDSDGEMTGAEADRIAAVLRAIAGRR